MIPTTSFQSNGRDYQPEARPIVVICIDGCADEYLDAAMARGLLPHMQRMSVEGWRGMCRGALPAFTNVNNASIVTGVPPAVHGICGNYFLDPDTGEEVMMNSPNFLRTGTLLAAASRAGRKVAVVTAKEKLRRILGHGLEGGIAFSSEKAAEVNAAEHGIDDVEGMLDRPAPEIYSGAASVYALEAGAVLIEQGRADFLYLSLTDYIQHKHAPDEEQALEFNAQLDQQVGRMLAAGATVGITADHGMNAKQTDEGSPDVIFLETELEARFGPGFRVILPITDPYVKHHGALGSFAVVHTPDGVQQDEVSEFLRSQDGVTEVHPRDQAAKLMELPADRLGELIVLSGRTTVLGHREEMHDLTAVQSGLRSHGGRYEEMVPLLISQPLGPRGRRMVNGDVRNFDVFDLTVNARL